MTKHVDGTYVKNARAALKLNQIEFGKELGLNKRTIVRWELGEVKLKKRDRLAIAALLQRARRFSQIYRSIEAMEE